MNADWTRLHSGRVASLNALSNAAVLGTNALATLLLLSYILRVMSKAEYGVWELTGAVFAYAGFLQLGLNSAINYRVPRHLVEGDMAAVNRVMSTTVGFYLGGSCAVVVGTVLLVIGLPHLFAVPAEFVHSGRQVMAMVGGYFALMLPLAAFQGLLTGTQNYLAMNVVRWIALVVRVLLMLVLVARGHGLFGLGLAHLIARSLEMLAMPVLARRVLPGLRVRPRYFQPRLLRELLGFGVNTFLWGASSTLLARGSLLVVGILLTTENATELGVVLTVVATVAAISDALSVVVRPAATSLMVRDETSQLRRLSEQATALVVGAILPVVVVLLAFGPGVLRIWLSEGFVELAPLLALLLPAQFLFETQRVGAYVTIGLGRHRLLGGLALGSALLGVGLAVVCVRGLGWGVWGVAVGHAAAVTLLALGILPIYVGRVLETGAWRGQLQPLVRPLLAVGPAVALMFFVGSRYQPRNLVELVGVAGLTGLAIWASLWSWGWSSPQRAVVLAFLASLRRRAPHPAVAPR